MIGDSEEDWSMELGNLDQRYTRTVSLSASSTLLI